MNYNLIVRESCANHCQFAVSTFQVGGMEWRGTVEGGDVTPEPACWKRHALLVRRSTRVH